MRRLILIVGVAVVAWTGWWAFAALSLRGSVQDWLAERRAAGWQAEAQEFALAGFPAQLALTMEDLALADPVRGVAVTLDDLRISAAAWWPGNVTVTFPATPVTLAAPDARATLAADRAVARLRLNPGRALQLGEMGVSAGPWNLAAAEGVWLSAQDLTLHMVQSAALDTEYAIDASAAGFTPGPPLRARLRVPDSWPVSFDALTLDLQIKFDRPWDLPAIEGARPQPQHIALPLAEVSWGDLLLRASGEVVVDENGVPDGKLSLQARNWQDMLTLAEASGALPPALRPQVERALSALAGASGNPDTIEVTLTLANEMISLGFLPLARAPRLIIR